MGRILENVVNLCAVVDFSRRVLFGHTHKVTRLGAFCRHTFLGSSRPAVYINGSIMHSGIPLCERYCGMHLLLSVSAVGRLGAQQRYAVRQNNDGVPFGSITTVYLFGSDIAGTETLQATRQRGPSCFWCRRKIRSLRSPVVPLFCEHGPLRLAVARRTLFFWPNKDIGL